MKWTTVFIVLCTTAVPFAAENSIPRPYAQEILNARLVAVVQEPGTGTNLENPSQNQRAIQDVEHALVKWGRFSVTSDPTQADLIIAVRKGRARATTVKGPNTTPPVVVNPNDTGVNIGVHRGTPPPLSRTDPDANSKPTVGTELGSFEDMFEVYRGHTKYPLDDVSIWRYKGKDALNAPKNEAVSKFRKAVEEAAKNKP